MGVSGYRNKKKIRSAEEKKLFEQTKNYTSLYLDLKEKKM